MTNEMKLLYALIDALGFDVKEVETTVRTDESERLSKISGQYVPTFGYKLTKKPKTNYNDVIAKIKKEGEDAIKRNESHLVRCLYCGVALPCDCEHVKDRKANQ